MTDQTRVLAARWVVPVVSEPIHRGWVRLRGEVVVEVGHGIPPSGATDLGDVALLPGLVNAHTHLEFSDCKKPIGEQGIALSQWITEVISARGDTTVESKQQAINDGLKESHEAGVRLIGEITTPPCKYLKAFNGPELVTFAEVLGLSYERAEERLRAAIDHNTRHEHGGLSPHAPYSTTPELVRRVVEMTQIENRPLAMHVAESPAERQLIDEGTGPFAESLKRLGVWREGLFPWSDKGFAGLIKMLADAPLALLIHGNDLQPDEIDTLALHDNMTVVYCPRTHAFFGYGPHPVDRLVERGVRVALGTDSRASNPDLSIWSELQHVLNHRNDLEPRQVLRMATVNGADVLRRPDVGRIAVGCQPGFGTVGTQSSSEASLWRDFTEHDFIPL